MSLLTHSSGVDMKALRIAATAAAGPSLFDSAMNNIPYTITLIQAVTGRKQNRRDSTFWAVTGASWMCLTAWDALAGFTFARVARTWGMNPFLFFLFFRTLKHYILGKTKLAN